MEGSENFYKNVLDNLYDGVYFVRGDRRISYWNRGAAELTGFSEAEVMGKSCREVFRHVNDQGAEMCGEKCPITRTIADGRVREEEMYFHHRDGHLVPVSLRVAPVREASGQVVVAVEIFSDNSPRFAVRQKLEQLEQMALCDPLTGLPNRRYTDASIYARLDEMNRYGWPFGILFIDIDHFKDVNDSFGHDVGDRVLRMVSATLLNSVRSFDILGRWGGEEFVAIIVNVDGQHLKSIANRFRVLVERSSLTSDNATIGVTVSMGATLARPGDTVEGLLQRADRLMYQSKKSGRNLVTVG